MFTHKRALREKNQCCSNLVFLYVMNKTVVWSPKNHERFMFVMFSHGVFNWGKVMLKPEGKCVCCICYWKLSAGEGNGWHSSVPEIRTVIHSVFHKLAFAQGELLWFQQIVGCRKGQTLVWQPKRGSWSSFIPHHPSPSTLAAAWHKRCSP